MLKRKRGYEKNCQNFKKAQTQISFGMIFSIIMIVVILAFSFYGIRWFLGFMETTQAHTFFDDLQADVNRVWRGMEGSDARTYKLPRKVEQVCFGNFDDLVLGDPSGLGWVPKDDNVAFLPYGEIEPSSKEINHLNATATIDRAATNVPGTILESNYYCIDVERGELKLVIESRRGESFVTLRKL